MTRSGIRITNLYLGDQLFKLSEIINEIPNGNNYYWSLLELYALGSLGRGRSTPEFTSMIDKSENGYVLPWTELVDLSTKFDQIIDMTLIGSTNLNLLHRYKNAQELYEACDFVIVMHDSYYWEVFSSDNYFIQKLEQKFTGIEHICSNESE